MKNKKNLYIVIYYIILLLVLASRTNVDSEPPMVLRLFYVFAVVLPCLVTETVSYPAIITVFLTIGHYGFAYSYMPYMTYIYGVLTVGLTLLFLGKNKLFRISSPPLVVLFTVYVFLVDLISGIGYSQSHFPEDVDWCFLMLICFFCFAKGKEENTEKQLSIAFAVITVVLSLLYLLFRDVFVQDYGLQSGLERVGWADPNYFGMVIGMGAVVGVYMMLSNNWKQISFAEKNLFRAAVIISLPTLALNASRGAILSVLVAVMILMMYTRAKLGYKTLLVIAAIVVIVLLYQNHYFDLLQYRIADDDGTGSNRTVIWARKLQLYSQGNILQWLFGFGYTGGFYITGVAGGFHNEFLAFLVDYGVVGLVMLVLLLYYPIKLSYHNLNKRPLVVTLIMYLVMCFLTLEPFTHALMMFFSYYFYACIAARRSVI